MAETVGRCAYLDVAGRGIVHSAVGLRPIF